MLLSSFLLENSTEFRKCKLEGRGHHKATVADVANTLLYLQRRSLEFQHLGTTHVLHPWLPWWIDWCRLQCGQ